MGDTKITEKTIDIRGVFTAKNPSLARVIPGFVFRYLKRVIHEDGINRILFQNREKRGFDVIANTLEHFGANLRVINEENIPKTGRPVVASNHPLGGLDGMALLHILGQYRKDVVFPVNDILLFLPNLQELFIPINKHGANYDNIRAFNETFASDKLILYFPAGLVSRKQKGKIVDLEWKKTFLTKAKQYQRDIVPVHIGGRNSNFFYNLANIRKKLGIASNIEMLYLPDEMFRQRNKNIDITFGKPVSYKYFDKRLTPAGWAMELKKHVYRLAKDPEADFSI